MKKRTGTVIQIICLSVFLLCGAYLGKYYYDRRTENKEFEELRQAVETADRGEEEEREGNGMFTAYHELYMKNNDLVGWIRIDGTKVDYPVMQSKDNEFYLNKNFEKERKSCGIPFADYQCDVDKPSDNVIIYAHNMKDGSMFASLLKYENKDFFESHKTIEFDTLYERGRYEVLYAFRTKTGKKDELKYCEFIDAGYQEEFYDFIAEAEERAINKNEIGAEYGDKLLTLSTCSYSASNERFVIIAKKIKQ